ncbi:MAG TPA: hypothetical protein VMW74_06330 [Nitrosopumilaceae archaeon]|nr:hypothetical protein [Nitrosopumilaceae archaeon]
MSQIQVQSSLSETPESGIERALENETKLSTLGLTKEDFMGLSWIFCEDEDC